MHEISHLSASAKRAARLFPLASFLAFSCSYLSLETLIRHNRWRRTAKPDRRLSDRTIRLKCNLPTGRRGSFGWPPFWPSPART